MLKIDPLDISAHQLHGYLLGAVAPRPIAFASTIDKEGNPNLSPFSFFNAFSANPPICVFSPARRAKDNTTKHTFDNTKEVDEVVINVVNYNLVQQASLSSADFPKGVNEFEKTGLTPIASEKVKPYRVKESPVQMECKVIDIVELGTEGGAGNLVICKIVLMHICEDILNDKGTIDPHKIDLVSRMGGNWYCRASGGSVFEVEKPLSTIGIGVDAIPEHIKTSPVLTGNNLAQLGNVEAIPFGAEVDVLIEEGRYDDIIKEKDTLKLSIHKKAKELLDSNQVLEAWKILLVNGYK
jgi:flavin reductase (DIM6/NTAB) family NADH-FMN oxidoreductase RutF